ncbi:MAG TPA: DJ-1/PfpI family protein [Acidimicrobiales bacterium]|nr:DJ-1/PfpI family protein [Acidimicrobiales bacterium]
MTRIGIFVFPEVEELDFVGPWEILRMWQIYWPADGAEVVLFAREPGEVTCAKGMRVVSAHGWDDVGALDVVIVPGGQGTRLLMEDAAHLDWVRSLAARGTLMTSVCTGSLIFGAAGLLDGRPATTHWASLEELRKLGTDIEVRDDDRWVDSGDVITASGVSAGIDMALHLVVRLHSAERAAMVKRAAQYDPAPPV